MKRKGGEGKGRSMTGKGKAEGCGERREGWSIRSKDDGRIAWFEERNEANGNKNEGSGEEKEGLGRERKAVEIGEKGDEKNR